MEEKIEQYLQKEYQDHIKWYKKHYYDTNYSNYENWYKEREEEYSDLVICDSCSEVVHEEDLINNDFITEGGALKICESCRNDGYGE